MTVVNCASLAVCCLLVLVVLIGVRVVGCACPVRCASPVVVDCLLCVVCCVLVSGNVMFVVCWSLFAVCCLLCAARCCLLFVVCDVLRAVC